MFIDKHYPLIVLLLFIILLFLNIDLIESNDNHNGTSNETIKRNEMKFKPSVLGKCTRCRLMSNSLSEVNSN